MTAEKTLLWPKNQPHDPREFAAHLGFARTTATSSSKTAAWCWRLTASACFWPNQSPGSMPPKTQAARELPTGTPRSAQAPSPADDTADDDEHARGAPTRNQAPTDTAVGSSYQQARAVKEKFLALEAKRAYEVAIGQLRDSREVEGLVATAMTELRLRLENLATTLAPELAAISDETRVRATMQDQFAHALESASHHFARLAAGHKP